MQFDKIPPSLSEPPLSKNEQSLQQQPDTIPPHLSAEEHSLRALEEQLLKDGKIWIARAADLYTRTPKIKIWVPVACSVVLTSFYLYTMHARAATPTSPAQTAPVAVVVPDSPSSSSSNPSSSSSNMEPPLPRTPLSVSSPHAGEPAAVSEPADSDASGDADSDLLKRAQQAHGSQRFAEEAADLQKVFDHSHAAQQVCPAIGKAYERAGQMDASLHAFEQCVSLVPGNLDIQIAYAHALQSKPDFKGAAAQYRECLQKDPANMDAQSGLALVELKQNDLHAANDAANAVLRHDPGNTDALLITGIAAWRQGHLPQAWTIFSKGVELDERRADFHAFLGRILEAQRRPQEALREYERSLALDPTDADIADRRDRLRDSR